MKIAFGSDHAGYDAPEPFYKPELIAFLSDSGHEIVDCGTDRPEAVDYPDIAQSVCETIIDSTATMGILLCGTGIGMSIKANRYPQIRAAVCTTVEMAELSRQHNDANVLCIGRRTTPLDECKKIIEAWLKTPFSGIDRHQRRVEKMC